MPGELDVGVLLRTLKVILDDHIYVFVTIPPGTNTPVDVNSVQMMFREKEGVTLIIEQSVAQLNGFTPETWTFPSKMITCDIHSSLEAVGFMPFISGALAKHGISCNPVSGYYHDHLFVPQERAQDAMHALETLSRGAQGGLVEEEARSAALHGS